MLAVSAQFIAILFDLCYQSPFSKHFNTYKNFEKKKKIIYYSMNMFNFLKYLRNAVQLRKHGDCRIKLLGSIMPIAHFSRYNLKQL